MTVEGPAWLRVDEQRDNLTYPSYRHIAEGLEHIRIEPQPGEEEALVRIHRLIEEKDRPVVPPRSIEVAQEPVPGPFPVISPEDPAVLARVNDAYSPGGQEDGTSSLRLSVVSRRDVDEDIDLDEDERFLEAGLSHRYYDEARQRYTFLDLAGRVREHGGPVLGLRGSVYHRLPSYPLSLDLESGLFVQNPDGGPVDPSEGETEWSFFLKARARALLRVSEKTYHIPSLSLFGRLSEHERKHEVCRAGCRSGHIHPVQGGPRRRTRHRRHTLSPALAGYDLARRRINDDEREPLRSRPCLRARRMETAPRQRPGGRPLPLPVLLR
ncbi:MAG: hypothetical protein MZV70_13725 [Desulfobacterales bacterium]|nr:hypothetical protein [Desulfobacterales bacterium]